MQNNFSNAALLVAGIGISTTALSTLIPEKVFESGISSREQSNLIISKPDQCLQSATREEALRTLRETSEFTAKVLEKKGFDLNIYPGNTTSITLTVDHSCAATISIEVNSDGKSITIPFTLVYEEKTHHFTPLQAEEFAKLQKPFLKSSLKGL